MQKELNPDLFGDRPSKASATESRETSVAANRAFDAGDAAAFLNLDRQIFDLRQQIAAIGDELKKVALQTQEFMKNTHLRVERIQQQLQRMEQSHNAWVQDGGHRLSQMSQRLQERKSLDQKIQELVDRHNQVIKSFEVRMNHLQRLLSEKEAQMVGAQAALNEAKMEISRLKRL